MTLCHGSNVEVREAKILKPKRGLDFGVVFYTMTNHDQAVAFTKHGRSIRYIPISFRPRQGGVKSINMKRIFEIGRNALRDFNKLNRIL